MRSPLPAQPRGPRRAKPRPAKLLLACPRISPEWELSALRALIKPQMRGKIAHRTGQQHWPAHGNQTLEAVRTLIADRLFLEVDFHHPEGEYFIAAQIPAARQLEGLTLTAALSAALPELWFTYGRLYLRGGEFYRRERGIKLWLSKATDIHLPREVRAVLRGHL